MLLACAELVWSHLETVYLVSREPHPISQLFILGPTWYAAWLWWRRETFTEGLSSLSGPQECRGGAGRMQEGVRPRHSEYDWKSYRHCISLWIQDNLRNLLCGLNMVTVAQSVFMHLCEGEKVRRRRCFNFHLLPSSTFITNLSWAKWMLRRSKLTLRVTEAASAVCGITFHPNGMDGGLTTVTLTLPLYTTLPRLTRLSGRGWD